MDGRVDVFVGLNGCRDHLHPLRFHSRFVDFPGRGNENSQKAKISVIAIFKTYSIRVEKERVGFTIPMTAYVLVVIFVATLIRSTFGFGEALIAVPLLALRLPVNIAAPLAVLVSTVIAGVVLVQDWRHVQLRSAVGLILSALPGIPLGVLLLATGNQHVVKSILGILIIGFSIYSLTANTGRHLSENHFGWLLGCGFVSGVLGGAYGMNGPPLAIYGALRKWTPQHFRATLQGYFLPASLVGLIGYASLGLWTGLLTRYFLLSLPAVAAAILLGRVINQRMTGPGFFRFVYVGLIAVGSLLFVQAMVR